MRALVSTQTPTPTEHVVKATEAHPEMLVMKFFVATAASRIVAAEEYRHAATLATIAHQQMLNAVAAKSPRSSCPNHS